MSEPPVSRTAGKHGPAVCAAIARRGVVGALGWLAARPARAAVREASPRVRIRTDLGDFVVALEIRRAPLTCTNFLRYVEAGKYDGGSFFRATRPRGAPEQGTIVGAPSPRSHPFPPIAHESTTATGLRHRAGAISLGRFAPGTATSNIFVCVSPQPYLDARPGAPGDNLGYAAFGQVVEGMAVVRRIHARRADGPSPFADQKGEWLNPAVAILGAARLS